MNLQSMYRYHSRVEILRHEARDVELFRGDLGVFSEELELVSHLHNQDRVGLMWTLHQEWFAQGDENQAYVFLSDLQNLQLQGRVLGLYLFLLPFSFRALFSNIALSA